MGVKKKEGKAKESANSPAAPSSSKETDGPGGTATKPAVTGAPANPQKPAEVATGEEPAQIPSLREVVMAASSSAPTPNPQPIVRPPLNAGATRAPSAASSQPSVERMTFAEAVTGPDGKKTRSKAAISSIDEIVAEYITPRPAPAESQLRGGREKNLHELFSKRWHSEDHGVCFEMLRGVSSEKYLEAISKVVPLQQVFALGPLGQGTILVTLNSVEAASELLLKGVELGGRHLMAFPEAQKPTRVVLSPVPPRVSDRCLANYLARFGKVQGAIRALPLRLGEKGLAKGIFSLSREAFVTLNPGCELPAGFRLVGERTATYIELTTDVRCYGCQQLGHQVARCPKRLAKKANPPPPPPTQKATAESSSDEEVPAAEASKKRRRTKKKKAGKAGAASEPAPSAQEGTLVPTSNDVALMPPPKTGAATGASTSRTLLAAPSTPTSVLSGSEAEKRPRSEESEEERALGPPPIKITPAEVEISDLSDADMAPIPKANPPPKSGNDTDSSVVSIGEGAEMEAGPLTRAQLRDLVKAVSSKKNMVVIKNTIDSFTTRYFGLSNQLRELMKEAKEGHQYNQETKLGRIIDKVEKIAVEAAPPSGER